MRMNSWFLGEVSSIMGGGGGVCDHHEQTIEDLKRRLVRTNMALEELRINANGEMQKGRETVKQLLQLLELRTLERDEARNQLQLLQSPIPPLLPSLPPRPLPPQAMGSDNSNVTEFGYSNVTEFGSSSADSLAKPASTYSYPEEAYVIFGHDQASAATDALAAKRPLPQRGKFREAVLKAGPLLRDLMLAVPLPHWRNPPPLRQVQVLPPMEIMDYCPPALAQAISAPLNPQNIMHNLPSIEKSGDSRHICAVPLLDFPS